MGVRACECEWECESNLHDGWDARIDLARCGDGHQTLQEHVHNETQYMGLKRQQKKNTKQKGTKRKETRRSNEKERQS